MNAKRSTSKDYYHVLKNLFTIIIAGQLLIGINAFLFNVMGIIKCNPELRDNFLLVILTLSLGGMVASNALYKKGLLKSKSKKNLQGKISEYKMTLLFRYGILEIPSITSTIAFLITGDMIFLTIVGIIFITYLYHRPTKSKIINDLKLDSTEAMVIYYPHTKLAESIHIQRGNIF